VRRGYRCHASPPIHLQTLCHAMPSHQIRQPQLPNGQPGWCRAPIHKKTSHPPDGPRCHPHLITSSPHHLTLKALRASPRELLDTIRTRRHPARAPYPVLSRPSTVSRRALDTRPFLPEPNPSPPSPTAKISDSHGARCSYSIYGKLFLL
jgi:hypothetical protein